jgi:hypothetical protein
MRRARARATGTVAPMRSALAAALAAAVLPIPDPLPTTLRTIAVGRDG